MAIDFPASPTDGQVFQPSGGPKYIYHPPAWYVVVDQPTGLPEAPLDGAAYGRAATLWEKVLKLVGGTLTGNLTISKDSPTLYLQKTAAAQHALIAAFNAAAPRWLIRPGNNAAEAGSDTGSDFVIAACNDGGSETSPPVMQAYRADRLALFNGVTGTAFYGIEGRSSDYRITFNTKFVGGTWRNAESNTAAHLVIGGSGLSVYTSPSAGAGVTQVLTERARWRGDGTIMSWGNHYFVGDVGNYHYGGTHNFYNASGSETNLIINTATGVIAPYKDIRMQGSSTFYSSIGGALIYGSLPSVQMWIQASGAYDAEITFDNANSGCNFGYRSADTRFYYGGFSLTPNQYKIYSALDGPMLLSVRSVMMQGDQAMQVKVNDRWMTVL